MLYRRNPNYVVTMRAVSIGNLKINHPVFLAPMSGVTDLPFRRIVKRYGAGLVFSEMIASRPMLEQFRQEKASASYTEEFPIAAQLAGCEPQIMAEAARINADRGAAIIDINFGCPVKKVVNNFAGSALMKDEKLAADIMGATVKAVSVPVTVKMRLGWDHTNLNAARLAKIAEDIGVQMITVHGRTRDQLYNGNADWDAVRAVKDNVRIPIIVNGDITDPDRASQALQSSGADGVMVGRASYGKPWILRQIIDHLKNETSSPSPARHEIYDLILEHYEALLSHYGLNAGVKIARKHIGWYCKDMPNSESLRGRINQITDPADVKTALQDFYNA